MSHVPPDDAESLPWDLEGVACASVATNEAHAPPEECEQSADRMFEHSARHLSLGADKSRGSTAPYQPPGEAQAKPSGGTGKAAG